jgi:hypothetical protein
MKEKITYVPEKGDEVRVSSSERIVVGVISGFGRHCSSCERYAQVSLVGKIIACPNVSDMKWNATAQCWEVSDDDTP